jgi:phage FluMu gp28-like protein
MSVIAIGVDVGREHDATAIVVAEKGNNGRVVIQLVLVLRNTPFPKQEAVIGKIIRETSPSKVAVDATGIGMEMSERLKLEHGGVVIPIMFTQQSKAELVGAGYNWFTADRVDVPPEYRVVAEEIRNIRKAVSQSGSGSILYQDAPHGDIGWACLLALWALGEVGDVRPVPIPEHVEAAWRGIRCAGAPPSRHPTKPCIVCQQPIIYGAGPYKEDDRGAWHEECQRLIA